MKSQARWLVGLSAGVLFTCASGAASAAFSSIYVFGDSLSDNGNFYRATGGLLMPPAYGYYGGRVSNGPVAVERMADLLIPGGSTGIHFFDYAFGGAHTGTENSWNYGTSTFPGLLDQVTQYQTAITTLQNNYASDPALQFLLPGGVGVDPNALYVVWAGPNDFVSVTDPSQIPSVIQAAVTNLGTAIGTLASLGAANFLVPNMVNLGLTPRIQSLGPAAVAGAAAAAGFFNQGLAGALALIDQNPALEVYEYNVFDYVQGVVADLAAYGFQSSGSYLLTCGANPSDPLCADPNNFLFFDDLHPTALAHQLIGKEFASAVPLPASLWLLASALALLRLRTNGRRRR